MQINILNLVKSIGQELEQDKNFINNFINEMEVKLNKMDVEYTIDRFEGDIAVCEDRNNNKMVEIMKENLPEGAKEGSIIKYENGKYILDLGKDKEIANRIKKKMDKLWNN